MNTMSITQQGTNSVAVDIMPGPAARIIERATRSKAPVRIEYESPAASAIVDGAIQSSHRDSLSIVVVEAPSNMPLRSTCCDAMIHLDGVEYMFAGHVLEVASKGEGALIDISRPKILQTWQRRRFVRASIADSATVSFFDDSEQVAAQFEGPMLNVSADGIACRVDTKAADRYTIDDRVRIRFALQPGEREYTITGSVRSKTPGGSPGTIILGVQFCDESHNTSDHADLAEALAAYL